MDYLGFYWTLPVNWAGFTSLPKDADEAAKASRTIRYQVERVRRWVAAENGTILSETIFMDTRPDRGTDAIGGALEKVLAVARAKRAELVLVDFSQAYGWRPHGPLFEVLGHAQDCMCLPPEPLLLDGQWWDPIAHFRTWREFDQAHQFAKIALKQKALTAAENLKAEGVSNAGIAAELNASGIKTANGRKWTPDNVRKFLASK